MRPHICPPAIAHGAHTASTRAALNDAREAYRNRNRERLLDEFIASIPRFTSFQGV